MNIAAKLSLALLAGTLTASSAMVAQAQTAGSTACTDQEKSNQTLSEKLGQTNGVICPPDVDPAIKAPAHHDDGAMPVIPPPDSGAQPK